MKNLIKFNLFVICLIFLLKIDYVFSQPDCSYKIENGLLMPCTQKHDSIKCIDIQFFIINYKLSLYNVAYTFLTKTGEILTINKKCNYLTTGILYDDRRTSKVFGFMKDSIYSIVLSYNDIDKDEKKADPLSYYSYVKFNNDDHTFNPQTFSPKKKIKRDSKRTTLFIGFVDIDNGIYSIKALPFHPPPDFLLPLKIYPFYKRTIKGDYVVNKKYKGPNNYWRIVPDDDGWKMEMTVGSVP